MQYVELENFYRANRDMLVKRVSRSAGGDYNAEDVVQEAFFLAVKYWEGFDPERRELGAWFNTILNNACKRFKRDERLLGMAVEFDEEYVEPFTPSETERDTIALVKDYIGKHGGVQRDVLELYFLREYKPSEIALVTEAKIKTINTWTYKAKNEMMLLVLQQEE